MAEANLNFKDNACRITLNVAGEKTTGTGFIYITTPMSRYNYVLTAKHIFQEDPSLPIDCSVIKDVEIWYTKDDRTLQKMAIVDLSKRAVFIDNCDLCIIKIDKVWIPYANRIFVRNIEDVDDDYLCQCTTYPSFSNERRVVLDIKVHDKKFNTIQTIQSGRIKDIGEYHGISGSGVYSTNEPYLLSVVSEYTHEGFEDDEMTVSDIDWNEINSELIEHGWEALKTGPDKYTEISDDRTVLNIGDVEINGCHLDLDKAYHKLSFDLRDDWYFDPLHYVDMCNRKFILKYFSHSKARKQYRPKTMETFYIPKKTLILRKAMIGNFIDRLVYTAIVDALGPLVEHHLSKNVYSAHYNDSEDAKGLIVSGVEQWKKMNYQILSWLDDKKGILVKADLLNYFDTINKNILIRHLREVADTEDEVNAVNLLDIFLKGIAPEDHHVGIPQNSDASSLLATFFISHVDEILEARTTHYCRFMDDIYFVSSDIYEARRTLQDLEKELRDLDLALNSSKIQFIDLSKRSEKTKFSKTLSTFDFKRQSAYKLVTCHQKARRMNGISILVDDINRILTKDKLDDEDERGLTFCLNILSNYKIHLYSPHWTEFYGDLFKLVDLQVKDPQRTPFLCRIIAAVGSDRDISEVLKKLVDHILKGHITYEWQAYNIWLLMAYLKYDDSSLFSNAIEKIDRNDENKRAEVAAIMIYVATLRPEYARVLLHKLRAGKIHGYLQQRAVMIACRQLGKEAIDNIEGVPQFLLDDHSFLHENKDKPLVFFHNISSYQLEKSGSALFPEFYSGL